MNPKGNSTFGIKMENDNERFAWAGYYIFVLFSSLIGNTTILIASMKYRAIKLHKLIVVIIQNIAVCDLLITIVSSVLPRLVSLIANGWILGRWYSYIQAYTDYYFFLVSGLLICALTVSKLFTLHHPLRAGQMKPRHAHFGCATIWGTAIIVPILIFIFEKGDVDFWYHKYSYDFARGSSIWKWLEPVLGVIFLLTPNIVVVITSVLLLRYLVKARNVAKRSSNNPQRWQGFLAIILTAAMYCVSVLPSAISHINFESRENTNFIRVGDSCSYFNTICNFYIYYLTISSFRRFVRSLHCCQFISNALSQARVRGTDPRQNTNGDIEGTAV